jgi:hypothetical protein
MALWGISTTQETWANSYAIPKFLNDQDSNNTPHNCFADERGWIYRRYASNDHSGLGTIYTDEVLVPVSGLNTSADQSIKWEGSTITGTATSVTYTGIAPALPVAVFFADPRNNSEITVAAGGTIATGPSSTAYVHVCYNENVFVSAGATINIQQFDLYSGSTPQAADIVAYAATAVGEVSAYVNTGIKSTIDTGSAGGQIETYNLTGIDGTDFAGQITNRVAFAFTAPATLLTNNNVFGEPNIDFASSDGAGGVGIATTTFFVAAADLTGVVAGVSSASLNNTLGIAFTQAPVVAVGDTFFTIGGPTGLAITIRDQQGAGVGDTVTFSNLTAQNVLKIQMDRGIVGTVTSFYEGTAAIKTFINSSGIATRPNAAIPIGIDRQVGGAGTFMSGAFAENYAGTVDGTGIVGLGTTALRVSISGTTF